MSASDEAKKALEGVTPKVWRVDRRYSFITHKDTWQVVWDVPNSTALCLVADTGGGGYPNERDARFIAWARKGVPALLAEIASKDAEVARLRGEIIEATDENFIWGAMDNVHDAETTLDDYAAAVSRAQRAAIASVKRWW